MDTCRSGLRPPNAREVVAYLSEDARKELNYPAIVKAILSTGFDGFLAQEFLPKREPFASLAQAFKICNV